MGLESREFENVVVHLRKIVVFFKLLKMKARFTILLLAVLRAS